MASFYSTIYRVLILGYIAYRSKSRKSLTDLGIAAALLVGAIHAATESSLYLNLVVIFFILGNISTKFKLAEKAKLTKALRENFDTSETSTTGKNDISKAGSDGGTSAHVQRTHIQVLANSLPATILILATLTLTKDNDFLTRKLLLGAVVNYAVATSDTWSSEFGILSQKPPILITSLKPCPRGTNGGISVTGLAAALAGSLIIGLVTAIGFESPAAGAIDSVQKTFVEKTKLVLFVTTFGVIGSLVDSLVGALFQISYVDKDDGVVVEEFNGVRIDSMSLSANEENLKSITGWDVLDNNGVNIVSISLTVVISLAILLITKSEF